MKLLMLKKQRQIKFDPKGMHVLCSYSLTMLLLEEDSAIKQRTMSSVRPSNSIQDAQG